MIQWRYFWRKRSNWLALLLILLFVTTAVAAPWLAPPNDPANPLPFKSLGQSIQRVPRPPSPENILGTIPQITTLPLFGVAPGQDAFYEWDVYYTLIWGTRSALRFGLVVTLLTAVIGITIGAFSAYWGGRAERLLMSITDAFLAFPVIAALWVIHRTLFSQVFAFFPDPETWRWWEHLLVEWKINPIMLTLILFCWMPYARMTNTTVAQLRQTAFVEAAVALGASGTRLLRHHLLPNALSPVIVLMARDVGGMVVLAATFVFIGFGGDIAWAIMLVAGRDFVVGRSGNPFFYWWAFVPIALALTLFSLSWNLLGDGLNEAMNPRRSR